MNKSQLGQLGESQAVLYLQSRGYKIIERNYRSGRWGEIDIIAIHQGDLVFVEVKTRSSRQYGQPIEAISWHKQQSLRRAAHYYKLTHPQSPDSLRIDVVEVYWSDALPKVVLYPNIDAN